ncbi:MAG: YkgJ family cysteine cluster protein [Saprospiraceae bacterium]
MNDGLSIWLSEARDNQEVSKQYLHEIKYNKISDFDTILQDTHRQVFDKVDCLQCANCCRTIPAMITDEDIRRISKHLKISSKSFKKRHVLDDTYSGMTLNGVPCRFLNGDNTCAIYEVRPEACRRYPHTDEKEYPNRIQLNLQNTLVCPAAYLVLKQLYQSMTDQR